MYKVILWRVPVTIIAMETQQYLPFFILNGVGVAVKNLKVFIVAMKMQKWVCFAVFSS